jgi:small subunit ribosomal protein S6
MERQMGLSEDVLRLMTVRVEAIEEGPSAMMQKRDEREGRGDRDGGRDGGRFGERDGGFRPRRRDNEGGDAAAIEGAI